MHHYMIQIGEFDLLSKEEEIKLGYQIQKGDSNAVNILVTANLRLVVKIAHSYLGLGLDFEDVVAEGNVGLLHAAHKFDPKHGAKFSTYAAWWIKQSIKNAIANQGRMVRIPAHLRDKLLKVKRAIHFLLSCNEEPTVMEIARFSKLKPSLVQKCLDSEFSFLSLDAPMGDEKDTRFMDILPDASCALPGNDVEKNDSYHLLHNALIKLPARSRQILELRFGFQGDSLTLDEVGKIFGVTRERIRQLEAVAISQLSDILSEKGLGNPSLSSLLPEHDVLKAVSYSNKASKNLKRKRSLFKATKKAQLAALDNAFEASESVLSYAVA